MSKQLIILLLHFARPLAAFCQYSTSD